MRSLIVTLGLSLLVAQGATWAAADSKPSKSRAKVSQATKASQARKAAAKSLPQRPSYLGRESREPLITFR